jgi:hypothetical protein
MSGEYIDLFEKTWAVLRLVFPLFPKIGYSNSENNFQNQTIFSTFDTFINMVWFHQYFHVRRHFLHPFDE